MTETTPRQDAATTFKETWALVELMGHTRVAGRITEESHFGTALMRCDIPTGSGPDDYFTQWYGGSAIYRITPIEEATARAFAIGHTPQPIKAYELPALTRPVIYADEEDYEDDNDEF